MLKNMVTIEELKSDEDYEDIMLDNKEECEKFGKVIKVTIPRPAADGAGGFPPGCGKVFVMFDTIDSAAKAQDALHGRLFDSRSVEATYMDQDKFLTGDFSGM